MTGSDGPPCRVLVVDDQALVRAGFVALLGSDPALEVVGEAGDGAEAIEVAAATHPDVVVMDIRMPGMDGIEATRHLAATDDPPGVLVLTTFDLDEYVYAALRAGASGFLLKDTPPAELIAAVKVVAGGDALLAPGITRRLIADFARAAPRPADAAHPEALRFLTDRETEVLVEIARGLSNTEIAEKLFVGEATVKTHVGRILAKLNLSSRAQAVAVAYESGLVVPGEP
ncbi:MAG TPA: response regulator transcription factor [Acidimicrobiales bacterium]|nr:response regulator transcription factor [Acidimicrobiales bacterium]